MEFFKNLLNKKEDEQIENFINYLKNLNDRSNWRKIFIEYLEKNPEGKEDLKNMLKILKEGKGKKEFLEVVDNMQYQLMLFTKGKIRRRGPYIRRYLRQTLSKQLENYLKKSNIY